MTALRNNPAAMLGMHDNAALFERHAAMLAAFNAADSERIAEAHARNVELFGWRDAEVLRHQAFVEAIEAALPVGEASDSGFSSLDEVPR